MRSSTPDAAQGSHLVISPM